MPAESAFRSLLVCAGASSTPPAAGLVGAEGAGAASEREPPLTIDGILTGEHSGLDPAAYSKGLLDVPQNTH